VSTFNVLGKSCKGATVLTSFPRTTFLQSLTGVVSQTVCWAASPKIYSLSNMEVQPREKLLPAQIKAVLRACDVGPAGLRVLPSRKMLSMRLAQSAHAMQILSVFDSCPAGPTEFARAVGAVTASQIRAPSRSKRIQPGRGTFSTTGRVCGRLLASDCRQHGGLAAGRHDNSDCYEWWRICRRVCMHRKSDLLSRYSPLGFSTGVGFQIAL
jgi:hypothetical protein